MNVAIIVPHFHDEGGVERRTSELVKGLLDEGHEVHVFASKWKQALVKATVGEDNIHRVPMIKGSAAAKCLSFAMFARRATSNGKFDIVHSQARTLGEDVVTAGGGSHRAWWECWLRDATGPFERLRLRLSTFHRLVLWMEKRQYARCRALIANSQFSRDCFIRSANVSADKIRVVHNGVDCNQFSPETRRRWRQPLRVAHGLNDSDLAVLHMGSGFFRKGVGELIRAVAAASRQLNRRIRLFIVGSGETRTYADLAHTEGIRDDVHFVGATANVEWYYAAADIFALLSRFDPFANSTLEALACGLPVITTATNGVSEILTDGSNGFVVASPGDVEQAAQRIIELADPQRRQCLGTAGRQLVEKDFGWDTTRRKTIAVYEEVLALKSGAPVRATASRALSEVEGQEIEQTAHV